MKRIAPAITDAEFNAVRALAAQGRPIPTIVMEAIVERLKANGPAATRTATALT